MGRLAEKQQRQAEIEARYLETLRKSNAQKQKKGPKRLPVSSLTNQLVWVDKEFEVRPLEAYPNRSYNQDKQVVGLIRHLYVKYSCPYWMYDVLRKDFKQPYPKMHETYRAWFLALAQGRSFTKMAKPYMNAKEAYYFLNAPYTEIHKNFWWARLKHAGVDERQAKQLIERIFGSYFFNHPDDVLDEDGRLAEVVTFYANHGRALDKQDFDAVTDFVAWKLRNDVEFRFKGRTSTSMIGLSNEWHHMMQKAKLGKHVQWKSMNVKDWEYIDNHYIWQVQELCDNKELANEGRKQKHCVFSYVSACVSGTCHIFSMRGYYKKTIGVDDEGNSIYTPGDEQYRVTIEVRGGRSVVQARCSVNRMPDNHEAGMLKRWAAENGIYIENYALRRW